MDSRLTSTSSVEARLQTVTEPLATACGLATRARNRKRSREVLKPLQQPRDHFPFAGSRSTHCAVTISSTVNSSSSVDTAFTFGVTPVFSIE